LTFQVIGAQGTRQTMLGFGTKEEAEAWIVIDQERGPINREFQMATDSLPEPSCIEEFFDHLNELETLLTRNVIDWSEENAASTYSRLKKLTQEMEVIGSKLRDHP
jgi:hypothetical protein